MSSSNVDIRVNACKHPCRAAPVCKNEAPIFYAALLRLAIEAFRPIASLKCMLDMHLFCQRAHNVSRMTKRL
eukprot:1069123-Amphidinium_carterae.1